MAKRPTDILPGTTISQSNGHPPPPSSASPLKSFPGPLVNGKPTTTTLYEPSQLATYPHLSALKHLINEAFRDNHVREDIMSASIDRLQSSAQYLEQIGSDPGTFVYILSWDDTGLPIGSAGAHRYVAPVLVADGGEGEGDQQRSAFRRVRLPAHITTGAEVWELKLMAVDLAVQRRGLASHLMDLVDEEVKRRVRADYAEPPPTYSILTTAKEANERFYRRKGYQDDYETRVGPGYLGSPRGFGVLFMSKALEV